MVLPEIITNSPVPPERAVEDSLSTSTPEQRATYIEKEILNYPPEEIARILRGSQEAQPFKIFHHSLSEWKNLRGLAAIMRLSGGTLEVVRSDKGEIVNVFIDQPFHEHDFPIWHQIFKLLISSARMNDKQFRLKVVPKIKKLFASTVRGEELARSTKSGGSNTFDHLIDFIIRLETDGLPREEVLRLRAGLFHDIDKVSVKGPFPGELASEVEAASPGVLAQLAKDDHDSHALIAGLRMQTFLVKYLMPRLSESEAKLIDDTFVRDISRMFRLHHLSERVDRALQGGTGLEIEQVHALFSDPQFEAKLLSLLIRLTAADADSVAAQSHNVAPERLLFAAINPLLIYLLMQSIADECDKAKVELSNFENLIARTFAKATNLLRAIGEEASVHVERLLDFVAEWFEQIAPAAINLFAGLPDEVAKKVDAELANKIKERHTKTATRLSTPSNTSPVVVFDRSLAPAPAA